MMFILTVIFLSVLVRSVVCETNSSRLFWWQKRPLVFSSNHSAPSTDINGLQGLLPDILRTVADSCQDSKLRLHSPSLTDVPVKQTDRLLKASFEHKIGAMDLAMPVKLRREKEFVLNMPFVKLLESPGIAVVIKKSVAGTELLKAILLAWPILIFVLLSALLSGFFIWFLEYRSNPQMFDPFCPKGVLNGFWFTSVTMTTVGYGDVTPKTLLGRLFTIIWISVGLVILAMYMGIVTASLTTTRLEVTQHFYGITVAAVNRTDEEKFAILHNANLKGDDDADVSTLQTQFQDNELEVIDAVYRGTDGVKVGFLDYYLASYYSDLMHSKKLEMVRVIPRKRAYGMILGKDWPGEVVDCLRQHTQDISYMMHDLVPKHITVKEHKQALTEYFSGSVFGFSIYVLLGVLCFLTILGVLYDRSFCKSSEEERIEQEQEKKR